MPDVRFEIAFFLFRKIRVSRLPMPVQNLMWRWLNRGL